MTTELQKFRQKYPMYNDMSDQEIADKLYAKYYSDMNRADFDKKLGLPSSSSDQSYQNSAPGSGSMEAMRNNFTQGMGKLQNIGRDVAQGAVQGVLNLGQTANRAETGIVNKLFGTQFQAPDVSNYAAPIGSGQNTTTANVARGIGQYAPYAAGEEVAAPISLLGKLLTSGTAGAASSLVNDENKSTSNSLLSALTNMLTRGASAGVEALRPSNLLRGTLSSDQLAKNLQSAQGTKTDLGSIINNPYLRETYATVIPAFPGTGAHQSLQQTNQLLQSKGKELLDKMLGSNSSIDVPKQLQDALKAKEFEVKAIKNNNYKALNDAADKAGISVSDENLNSVAQQKLADIMASPRLSQEASPTLLSDLNRYSVSAGESDINPATGQAIKSPESMKSSDIFRGVLGDKAQNAYEANDSLQSGIYSSLKEAKNKDIEDAIDNSGNDELKGLRDNAHKFYKEELAPFFDPDVLKFTHQGGDPDTMLNAFLKTSRVSDRSRLLGKLMDKMPEEKQNLVPYAYYSRALNDDGSVNPQKLVTLHQNLGTNQENVLFKDKDLQKKMNDYTDLAKLNTEAMNAHVMPKTGARNRIFAPFATASAGMNIGALMGGPAGAALGAVAGLSGPMLAGQAATKALTSENLRNNLVKEMLKNRNRFGNNRIAVPLAQGLLNAQGGQ